MQNNIARMLEGLEANQIALFSPDHPRWWEFPAEPPTPIPVNVKYACDATLGNPSMANCEAALYEFIQSGDVILDPALGPIIKVSGGSSDSHPDPEASSDCQSSLRELRHCCRSKRKAFHNMGYATECYRDLDCNMHK